MFSMPPAVSIDSERISLRQLGLTWLDEVEEFVNNPELSALTGTKKRFSREVLTDWLASRPSQSNRCDWAILDRESGDFLGEVVLNELDEAKNSMNLRISLASLSLTGQGIGSEAIELVLTYAFDQLQLSKVTLEVLTTNPRAHAAYSKVGFVDGRQFSEGKLRYQRMSIDKLQFVQAIAKRSMARFLAAEWQFAFDSGKRRAGICVYTDKQIRLSKHLVNLHSVEDARQVMWHEIAHAICGKDAGHGKEWLATAKGMGYKAEKFTGETIAENTAPWSGTCPKGHMHYRYRKPTRQMSCGKCSRSFSRLALITWQQR
ncbi:MAG: SprT-like domain-containing protein [Micrococcales bacterium]